LPHDWSLTPLNELGEVITGSTPSTKKAEYWGGKIPFVTPGDIGQSVRVVHTKRTVTESGLHVSRALPADAVLVTCIGATIGKLGITSEQCSANQQINALVCNEGAVPVYVYYALANRVEALRALAGHTAVPIVNKRTFEQLPVPLPPLGEQRKIAAILSAADELIEQTEAVIEQPQVVKRAMMQELLTRGLPGRHNRFKNTEIGEIPESWQVSALGDVTERITDGSHQSVNTTDDGEIPFLYVSCVRDGRILWKNAKYIGSGLYSEISKGREPEPGVILYTAVGSYGHAALVETTTRFAFQRHIAYIRPQRWFIEPGFLAQYLNGPIARNHADEVAVGNAQKTVTLRELRSFPVLLPPLEEQTIIAQFLASLDRRVDEEFRTREDCRTAKSALMSVLLTGEVRVKPDEDAP
jgi:type I restriction enzyme, S subunit